MRLWLRRLRARPVALGFLLLSLSVSLAGGLAAISLNTAVLWRALPFEGAESLVSLELRTDENRTRWWSGAEFASLAEAPLLPFVAMAAYTGVDINALSEPGRPPEALLGTMVSPDFFRTLGVGVRLGRGLTAADFSPGNPRVVVLGHELWQRRYGADPGIIGRAIRLAAPARLGEPDGDYLVVGVLRADTWLFWKRTDFVLPLRAANGAFADPHRHPIERVIARVAPGATTATGRLRASELLARVLTAGSTPRATGVVVADLKSTLFRDLRPQLLLVLTIAVLVLGLAGLNVVIGATAQALEGQRDTAIRVALGASPGRVALDAARQLALTVAAAGVTSVVLAMWFIGVVVSFVPDAWLARVPGAARAVYLDASAAGVLVLVTGGIVGAVGLWTYATVQRLTTGHLLASIQPVDTPHRQRWRAALVCIEIALCATTVTVATALLSQLWHLRTVDLGVRADHTLAVWINASPTAYADPVRRAAYFERLLDEARRIPGVESAAGIDLPFYFEWQSTAVRPDTDRSHAPITALDRVATVDYRDAAGLAIVDGRWIDARDDAGAPAIAVVSRSLADALWPNATAVGRTMQVGGETGRAIVTVAGVVSDTRTAPHSRPSLTVYRPVAQAPPPWLYLVVRTTPGANVVRPLTDAVWRTDPDQPVDGPWSVRTWIDDRTAYLSFLASFAALLAGLGVVLAAAGLHGLTTWWVESSSRELGIRRAVGASHASILAWYTKRWLGVVAPALIAGAALQAVLLRTAAPAIEGLQPASLGQLVVGAAIVALYAGAASGVALRRALRVDVQDLMR
jgi:putative ABC transport system permease protein